MYNTKGRILWIENNIKSSEKNSHYMVELTPYVRFLEYNGYDVTLVDNREDGVTLLNGKVFHCIIINHVLPVKKYDLFSQIRKVNKHLPIILLTESTEPEILTEASLHDINDVLLMPTNPRQLVVSLTLLLERKTIRETYTPQLYVKNFNSQFTLDDTDTYFHEYKKDVTSWEKWIETYLRLVEWEINFDDLSNVEELKTIHAREKREANSQFSDFIEENYSLWLKGEDSPPLSVDVFYKYVLPEIQAGKSVLFVVMDCLRLDHWLKIEPLLEQDFYLTKHYYYSILPTTTRYSRNAIFSGMFPIDIAERYPELYAEPDDMHTSINRFEKDLMKLQLDRYGISLKPTPHYFKIFDTQGEIQYLQWLNDINRISLAALVVDFLDMLTHLRSDVHLFQQLIPGEEAFREIVETWFRKSQLYKIIKLAADRGITIIITSDHGSVLCENAIRISSPHGLSSGLRAKEGKDITCAPEAVIQIKDPSMYCLPSGQEEKNYILAKENYFFVYDKQFDVYKEVFEGSYQHGGVSMEEMILPCIILEQK